MPKQSAGLLLYRYKNSGLQVFLVHPGGPFWAKKDEAAWTIPKGEFTDEDPLQAAQREFEEETSLRVDGEFIKLTPVKQSNKIVHAWAVQADVVPSHIKSNTFTMEWPPKSGKQQEFPEVDKAAWFALDEAKKKILKGQRALLDELAKITGEK